ncbi:TMV resistance protein N-like protein [Tanacetum coccineum]
MDGSLFISSPLLYTGSPTGRWTYDVFLSFRGEDTCNNFVDHLYAALDRAGLYTFKDDQNLLRGKPISPELVRAIKESRVALVVFSKNYANFCWCLDELAKIIELFKQHGMHLINNMDKVKRWREALETATNLSGWDVPRTANGHEAECIKQILRNILSCKQSRPAEDGIGMESRIQHLKSLLGKGSDHVSIIGILGMGGIGKLTIAIIFCIFHLAGDEFSHYSLHISWPCLEEMDISRNLFTLVPASISRLSHLKHLDLTGCINLKELNELPSLIQVLKAESCTSLKKIRDLSTKYKWLFKISLFRCPKLLENQES